MFLSCFITLYQYKRFLYRYYTMVYLPNEIINLILSFREINPVSLLIKDSVEKCEKENSVSCVKFPYYILSPVSYHNSIFLKEYDILYVYYEKKDKKLTNKKKMKDIKFTSKESIMRDLKNGFYILRKKHDSKIIEMKKRYKKSFTLYTLGFRSWRL